jgi:hypothetical protein
MTRARADVFCKGKVVVMMLAAEGSSSAEAFALDVSLHGIVSASVPEGTYFATLTLELDEPPTAEEVPAGIITLRRR